MDSHAQDIAARLAQERRARLAAERLLAQKQSELVDANRKLGKHARKLGFEITETRAMAAEVVSENQRYRSELGAANQKIQLVEGQLWTALQTVRDGFAMFNGDGLLELANPAFLAIFEELETIGPGTPYPDILGIMAHEGIVNLEGLSADEWIGRMLWRWDQIRIPDVTIRLFSGQFIKIQDRRTPDGGIVTLATDITDLMRMWSAVSELPDGFVLYDSEDRLLLCNEPYRQMYSKSAKAMVPGTPFEEILRYGLAKGQYAEAVGREEEWLETRLDAHRQKRSEVEHQLADGRWIRAFEIETSDGGRVGLRVDITRLKQVQADLVAATMRAEEASRAKSAFLANMSHEIRTPMNGVVGMAGLLMEDDLTEEQRLYVETIKNSGEALLVIINDILDYSKIEAEKMVLHSEPFDLERAIHEIMLLLQPSAQEKGLELVLDYDLFLPTHFIGDPGRIRQILTNLMGNAVKFTAEGNVVVRVVGLMEDAGTADIRVTVEDTGIGIGADMIDHVFGEFNQVEDGRNRKFEGTGLGLAITRRLVELMKGEVWVDSEEGAGSCFGFRLHLPVEGPVTDNGRPGASALGRALVVSTHSTSRAILSKQLGALGAKTRFCATAAEALNALQPKPDVVIIEDPIFDMSAADLAHILYDRGFAAPTLIFSADVSKFSSAKLDRSALHVVQKPVARRALFEALATVLAQTDDAAEKAAEPPLRGKEDHPVKSRLDVLVAEDNKTNQLVFRKMVKHLPLDLRFAENGLLAVEAFAAKRPDLIFMDISMPKMDGKEATREIRRIEGDAPPVPIVAVTAHAMTGDREGVLEAGLTDYLTKPLRKPEITAIVAKYAPMLDLTAY